MVKDLRGLYIHVIRRFIFFCHFDQGRQLFNFQLALFHMKALLEMSLTMVRDSRRWYTLDRFHHFDQGDKSFDFKFALLHVKPHLKRGSKYGKVFNKDSINLITFHHLH